MAHNQMTALISNEEKLPHRCEICHKEFPTKVGWRMHQTIHLLPYVCSLCHEGFRSWSRFSVHMRTHPEDTAYILSDNGDRDMTLGISAGAKTGLVRATPFACADCGVGFMQQINFEAHVKTHKLKRKAVCADDRSDSLSSNAEAISARGEKLPKSKVPKSNKPFLCTQCDEGFMLRRSLEVHMKIHRKREGIRHNNVSICILCNTSNKFHSDLTLKAHIRKFHAEAVTADAYVCPQCGVGYNSVDSLFAHMERHAESGDRRCSCGRLFYTNTELIAHKKINPYHTNHVYHKCTYCGDSFYTFSSLNSHIKSNHVKRFKCAKCDEAFNQEACLRAHMINHTMVKRFCCRDCDAAFTKSDSLSAHIRGIHKLERTCQLCGKQLSSRVALKRHIGLIHPQEKLASLSDCSNRKTEDESGKLQRSDHPEEMQHMQHNSVKVENQDESRKSQTLEHPAEMQHMQHNSVKVKTEDESGNSQTSEHPEEMQHMQHNSVKVKAEDESGKSQTSGHPEEIQHSQHNSVKVKAENESGKLQRPDHPEEMQCTQCGEVFSGMINMKSTGDQDPFICFLCAKQFSQMFGIELNQ